MGEDKTFGEISGCCASAERVCWTKRSEEIANGEGVASGSATRVLKKDSVLNLKKNKKLLVLRQSPFARKALCITGRAGPLACAAAADRLRP